MARKGDARWRLYERIVAAVEADHAGIDLTITPNTRITGCITGIKRQIDVLIDGRWGDDRLERRVIVDAKCHRRKIDVKEIERFEGMMKDCQAQRGVIVCPNGHTATAQRRAQDAINIKLLPIDHIEDFPWAQFDPCLGTCAIRDRSKPGLVLWDGQLPIGIQGTWAIVWTGKCDCCHNFHAWCWDCGEKFALADEAEYACGCGRTWVTAIEEEVDGPETLNAVHFFMIAEGGVYPIDRRRLR